MGWVRPVAIRETIDCRPNCSRRYQRAALARRYPMMPRRMSNWHPIAIACPRQHHAPVAFRSPRSNRPPCVSNPAAETIGEAVELRDFADVVRGVRQLFLRLARESVGWMIRRRRYALNQAAAWNQAADGGWIVRVSRDNRVTLGTAAAHPAWCDRSVGVPITNRHTWFIGNRHLPSQGRKSRRNARWTGPSGDS